MIFIGDFNFHVDDPNDYQAKRFTDYFDLLISNSMLMGSHTKMVTP